MSFRLSTLSIAAILLSNLSAPADDREITPPPENCRVTPPETGDQGEQDRTDPQTTQSLSGKRAPCDGVLKPPAVGDQELTQPPPDTGKTLVIRPHQLPEQQSKPQGD